MVEQSPASKGVLLRYQGHCTARGSLVDVNLPGVYAGPLLPWDKAEKIARKGVLDCLMAHKRKELVTLKIPGQPERRGYPMDVIPFFRKLLRAARMAKENYEAEMRIFQSPR